MITYTDSLAAIDPEMLRGFFEHWKKPPSAEVHLQILRNSDHVFLALDSDANRVVGFITALTDSVQSAFIPLLEVLPEYRRHHIGSTLVRMMLETFKNISAIDLTCDPEIQSFYASLGMRPSVGMIVRNY